MLKLTDEAMSYYQALPEETKNAMKLSNLTFRTLEDLKSYEGAMMGYADEILYQTLPEPAIPSNSALDPLDSTDP